MRHSAKSLILALAAALAANGAPAADVLPAPVRERVLSAGLPLASFGIYVHAAAGTGTPLVSLNAEQPYLLASTTKLVTSLAALDLLGADFRWRAEAYLEQPPRDGRLAGDLRLVGHPMLTRADLRAWFKTMRGQGLREVSGNVVLEGLTLMPEHDVLRPAGAVPPVTPRPVAPAPPAAPVATTAARIVVMAQPSNGERADVTMTPRGAGVELMNEIYMRDGCQAWAQYREAAGGEPARVWVRGQWSAGCGRREVAFLVPPPMVQVPAAGRAASPSAAASAVPTPPAPPTVPVEVSVPIAIAQAAAEAGVRLRGRVIERAAAAPAAPAARTPWAVQASLPLPQVIREINKTSDNVAARQLLLSLATPGVALNLRLPAAQGRVEGWMLGRGLAGGDIRIDQGSGQSRGERGKPRALAHLLAWAWKQPNAGAFVDSLPVAGVDGTLSGRMLDGWAAGHAYLKTGTLGDTRALAGYVRGKTGKFYAVVAIVNHAQAARAAPALDAVIEWIARNG